MHSLIVPLNELHKEIDMNAQYKNILNVICKSLSFISAAEMNVLSEIFHENSSEMDKVIECIFTIRLRNEIFFSFI